MNSSNLIYSFKDLSVYREANRFRRKAGKLLLLSLKSIPFENRKSFILSEKVCFSYTLLLYYLLIRGKVQI